MSLNENDLNLKESKIDDDCTRNIHQIQRTEVYLVPFSVPGYRVERKTRKVAYLAYIRKDLEATQLTGANHQLMLLRCDSVGQKSFFLVNFYVHKDNHTRLESITSSYRKDPRLFKSWTPIQKVIV